MGKTAFHYFAAGQRKAARYCRRSFGNRLMQSLFQPLSLFGVFSVVFTSFFATSNYGFNYMLKEADDAILEKSFDGTEKGKLYLSTLVASLVLLGLAGTMIGFGFLLWFIINTALTLTIPNPLEASIFGYAALGIIMLIAGIGAIFSLLTLQASLFLINKNKALGVGDVLYNAMRFVRKYGLKLFLSDLFHVLLLGLIIGAVVGGFLGLNALAASSYNVFQPMLTAIAYAVLAIGVLVFLFFGGQLLMAMRYSAFAILSDYADATKYVVVYPEVTFENATTKKGRFLEVVDVEDDETHPLEPHSTDEEEPE